jgi:gluconate 5-dehydrogenase
MKQNIKADLSGKNALITGSSHGLGAFYAEVLAKNGAHVIVSGRKSSEDQLEQLVNKITTAGYKATKYIIDLTDFSSFDKVITSIHTQVGNIDIKA